ncbi:MAG TPA: dTMP kinase [Gammaproteobacteria bacterium]|nr:dTMP kinase [Gammaproteobacteria bacterium]
MRGKLITIEGTEGAGKSTALAFIQAYLEAHHRPVTMTREPGGTPIGEAIRNVLLHTPKEESLTAEAELLLMFAARAQHIKQVIMPALQAGQWVVSDRYVDASYAYQGGGRLLGERAISFLDHWVVGDYQPDLTLLFDLPVEVGLARAEGRGTGKDRIEQEKIDFFERVRQAYLTRAKEAPQRIKIIDASQSPEAVQAAIATCIRALMEHQLQ